MAANGSFLKLYNMMGNYRSLLTSRIILPSYQPVATVKRSIEEMAGVPQKPRKPLTPYFTFMKNLRPLVTEQNPKLRLVEVTKLLAQEWKKADEQLKAKLRAEYNKNMEIYNVVKAEHYNSLTDEQKRRIEKARLEAKHARAEKLQRKEIKSLSKPKRPGSPFAIWVSSLGAKRGSMKLSEWQKSLVPKWEALPEKVRADFEAKSAEAMANYKLELRKWEEQMIKLGKRDLTRYGMIINQRQAPENEISKE